MSLLYGSYGKGVCAMKLTILVPAFNEEASVAKVIQNLLELHFQCDFEIIVVDDGSTDDTFGQIETINDSRVRVLRHQQNQGKGGAIHSGIELASGTHILIFDADFEYDHSDIERLIAPILRGRAEVVFGSRKSQFGTVHPSLMHAVGNVVMTSMANIMFNSAISDMHTCLKLFPLPLVRSFKISETGFGLDTELVAEMLRSGFRPYEVPISYVGRSREDGKKIRAADAMRCLFVLLKVRCRPQTSYGARNRALSPIMSTNLA
jgi:glycosyltransferase involved in cell wall biosynthesis